MEKQYYAFDEKFILTDHVHSSVDIFGWQGCAIYGYAETIRVVKPVAWFLHLVCFFLGAQNGVRKKLLEKLRRLEGL